MIYFAPFVYWPSRMLPPHPAYGRWAQNGFVIYGDDLRWQDLENPRRVDVSMNKSAKGPFSDGRCSLGGLRARQAAPIIRLMEVGKMSDGSELYDQDFFLWTQQQAAALRQANDSNLPLDWENLAEEIESLGKSDRRELTSQLRRILRHLFKLEASPAPRPRTGWRATIVDARSEIESVLRDSPSLRRQIDDLVREQLKSAAELAANDLGEHGEPADLVRERLRKGGFTAEQVLGDWFPEPSS